MLFLAVYNVLYEKFQQEPKKGIVACKGKLNQRKMTWENLLNVAHELEDYFTLRKIRTGCSTCNFCKYWKSVSTNSPYIGECTFRGIQYVHAWGSCKKFKEN